MKTILSRTLIVALILGTGVLGYPPQERLMPDGAPVPEDAVIHEDSIASASETGEDYADGDDSDMYMETDGEETMTDHEENRTERIELDTTTMKTDDKQNDTSTDETDTKDQETKNTELSPQAQQPSLDADKSLETESQNFFPSFAELFSNHRLPLNDQQQRYRPNRFLGYFQRDRGVYQTASASSKEVQHPLLGSGNFGVIRGGTYYPEDKENEEYAVEDTLYNPYYHGATGRARANYYRNPKPQPVRGGDFFANFRDFADITAPPKSSFSHLSVVYANKNGSSTGRITEPRNIIETLRMLEEEEQRSNVMETATTEIPRKKLSKGKRKLIKMKQYDEDKARRSRVTIEPLLALS
ncbi:PREDICTED: uncharacterized protein LOC107065463 [Polistes dominula]|uniref:Uncharacterized protein LOC107065463 n=1 Tax=Polistes dominula TaxID=743375 RepID=A0ABM1I384_POLDO|nr:PREDICTED: uncharacterized protein LOC107065463 [Polistes dominula]